MRMAQFRTAGGKWTVIGLMLAVRNTRRHARLWADRRGDHRHLSDRDARISYLGAGRRLAARLASRREIASVLDRLEGGRLWAFHGGGLLAFVLLGIGTAAALGLLQMLGLHYGSGSSAFVPPLWATALVVLRAGIAEEVCFRGYAIERIEALTGGRAVAGLVPLIAFASFHYRQGIAGILVALILGAINELLLLAS